MARFPDPPHAHVPGQTPRHPEGTFAALCNTVQAQQPPGAVFASDAWRAGLQFLETGYFWEAHEVWEAVWMALPEGTEARRLVQGMIQLANAELKQVMQRPKASLRLCEIALTHLQGLDPDLWDRAGIQETEIRNRLVDLRQSRANYAL
ncbi:DUF309 domain-containing protein [Phaeobacter sp. PT47_59]|uniref:DUF309 domain-containing protein n=1 Tax=Phaeobacter sp. PT47_59 TaxID=3029979 RepID=UPI002380745C|nr:DUF309 domain-containing protein [Phaeobacter sp. PT47_59]MDE4173767.1 DUF309 domain-containing protein [Phaeobacter sp. PT47_59]